MSRMMREPWPQAITIRTAGGAWLATEARVARRFLQRLRGLLGTDRLPEGAGLWIEPGGSVHTFGMRYPIDVVFVDGGGCVLRVLPWLRPGRLGRAPRGCRAVLELPAGRTQRQPVSAGERLVTERAGRGATESAGEAA